MATTNRQWVLKTRPTGMIGPEHFEFVTTPIPSADLTSGDVLVKTLLLSFDPAQRGWVMDVRSYLPPVQIGEPMRAFAIGQVIASENDAFPEGSLVTGLLNWQEYGVISQPQKHLTPVSKDVPLSWPLSVLGVTSLTAYFGLLDVGLPKGGETVLVSGGAGATGSVVAQIAKLKGCNVIAIAGGEEKCQWLRDECGVDHTIDYKTENLRTKLAEISPNGIDIFFDNVGGKTLEIGLGHMSDFGRVIMCGAISGYNDEKPEPGPKNLTLVITRRLRMQGFIVMDYQHRYGEALVEISQWVKEGRLHWREDMQHGFENIPATLQRVYDGRNQGKQLLKIADPQ